MAAEADRVHDDIYSRSSSPIERFEHKARVMQDPQASGAIGSRIEEMEASWERVSDARPETGAIGRFFGRLFSPPGTAKKVERLYACQGHIDQIGGGSRLVMLDQDIEANVDERMRLTKVNTTQEQAFFSPATRARLIGDYQANPFLNYRDKVAEIAGGMSATTAVGPDPEESIPTFEEMNARMDAIDRELDGEAPEMAGTSGTSGGAGTSGSSDSDYEDDSEMESPKTVFENASDPDMSEPDFEDDSGMGSPEPVLDNAADMERTETEFGDGPDAEGTGTVFDDFSSWGADETGVEDGLDEAFEEKEEMSFEELASVSGVRPLVGLTDAAKPLQQSVPTKENPEDSMNRV